MDLQAAGQAPGYTVTLDAGGLREMHARKTGALIRASAVSGAIMAGADDDLVSAVDRYAADVGLAFQIVDDILDIEGSLEALGKTAGSDARKQKATYPALHGIEASRREARRLIERAKDRLAVLGDRAAPICALADFVIERKS
jgi:geranylgeranyl pyrophosphate synthase